MNDFKLKRYFGLGIILYLVILPALVIWMDWKIKENDRRQDNTGFLTVIGEPAKFYSLKTKVNQDLGEEPGKHYVYLRVDSDGRLFTIILVETEEGDIELKKVPFSEFKWEINEFYDDSYMVEKYYESYKKSTGEPIERKHIKYIFYFPTRPILIYEGLDI